MSLFTIRPLHAIALLPDALALLVDASAPATLPAALDAARIGELRGVTLPPRHLIVVDVLGIIEILDVLLISLWRQLCHAVATLQISNRITSVPMSRRIGEPEDQSTSISPSCLDMRVVTLLGIEPPFATLVHDELLGRGPGKQDAVLMGNDAQEEFAVGQAILNLVSISVRHRLGKFGDFLPKMGHQTRSSWPGKVCAAHSPTIS